MTGWLRFVVVVLVATLTGGAAAVRGAQKRGAVMPAVIRTKVGSEIDTYLARLTAFGFSGAVIMAKGKSVQVAKGYGLANRERGIRCNANTVFTIGSITKQFTGAAILKLEMQGALSVQDPITKFFDNVPEDKAGITVHHLLTHTAGLVDSLGGDHDLHATREWVFREAMSSKLKWRPGTRHSYSNLGYSLLGMIVEKASSMGYEQFLREYLFAPAEMLRTGYLLPNFTADERAVGYRGGEAWGTVLDRPMLEDGPCWNLRANGGIHSTIVDMFRWHQALLGSDVLSDEAKKKYFAPHVDEGSGDSFYGYGWVNFKTPRGTRLLAHNGGNMIFSADFRRYVDENVMFFLASNTADFFVDPISSQIARIIFGEPYTLPPRVIKLDPKTLAGFQGSYVLAGGSQIEVGAADGWLELTPAGQEAYSLLSSGRKAPLAKLEELNARTAKILEESAKGRYTQLVQAFGGELSADQVAAMAREHWREREARLGKFKRVEVLGSAPYRMGMMATTARLVFERGSQFVRYGWAGKRLAGMRSIPAPPEFRFHALVPGSVDESSGRKFVRFTLGARDHVQIGFQKNADGAITALAVTAPQGDVVAGKK